MPKGIILKGIGGFYEVLDASDLKSLYTCKVRGIHRKSGGITPLPGDHVVFKILDQDKRIGHVEDILKRRNEFIRPPVANIDQLAVVLAAASPEPDFMLMDKLLIMASAKNIRPIILINKADLDTDNRIESIKAAYEPTGYKLIVLSKCTEQGYDLLHEELNNAKTAFAGQSGVGKSTILNIILKHWYMETGEVSERIQRGKHTTRHVQLFELEGGGFVMDTPGFSTIDISDISHDSLDDFYPEFSKCEGECRFKGCSHIKEPDCAVKDLVVKGMMDQERYNRYVALYNSIKDNYDNRYRR